MKLITSLFLFILSVSTSFGQLNCDTLRTGSYLYFDENDNEVFVLIEDKIHTEFHETGKYYIRSKVKWINNCEYIATLQSSNIPNFEPKKGAKMKTRFIETKGNKVIYESSISGNSWSGEIFKINAIPFLEKH